MKVDLKKLEDMIENYNLHITNTITEQIRIQSIANERILFLDAQIKDWNSEIEELQKQIEAYKILETELPKEEETIEAK